MAAVLDVRDNVEFDETIIKYQEHVVVPQTGTNYGHLAEISMEMGNLDVCTLPWKSYIYLEGKFLTQTQNAQGVVQQTVPQRSKISNNGFLHLFESASFHLNSVEVDRTRELGIVSTMKNFVSLSSSDAETMVLAGWDPTETYDKVVDANGRFAVCIPLSSMLGFAEDHRKVIVHARQRLTLRRTLSDINCYETNGAAENCFITLTHISWRLPFVTPTDTLRLDLLRMVEQNRRLTLGFRSWDIIEYPLVPQTTDHVWTIMATTQLEKPRYVIVGFQTGRKDTADKSASEFDHCNLRDIKVYIENEFYPVENLNISFSEQRYFLLYRMFAQFRESYYGKLKTSIFCIYD